MTDDQYNQQREHVRGAITTELAQLVSRAASHGLVLHVELARASPLVKPVMRFNVRHARGFYLKENT